MKANKRSSGICMASDFRPKSTVRLEGEHAETAVAHPIGKKVKIVVHATKMSHSKNMDGTHSASYDINKIENVDNEKTDKHNEGKAQKAMNADA